MCVYSAKLWRYFKGTRGEKMLQGPQQEDATLLKQANDETRFKTEQDKQKKTRQQKKERI